MKKSMLFLGMLVGCGAQLYAGIFSGIIGNGPGLIIVNKSSKPVIAIMTHGNCRVLGNIKKMVQDNVGGAIDHYFDRAIKAASGEKPTEEPGKDSSYFNPQKRLELQRDTLKGSLEAYAGAGEPCAIRQIPANGGTSGRVAPSLADAGVFTSGFSLIITDLDGNIIIGRDPQRKGMINIKDVKGTDIQKNKVTGVKADTTVTIDEAGVMHYTPQAAKPGDQQATRNH